MSITLKRIGCPLYDKDDSARSDQNDIYPSWHRHLYRAAFVMLLRLDALDEIGRFSTLRHRAEPFTKLSLIFARNGFGKSTLCAVLRSATDGNANHINARRRLGATKETKVQSTWHPAQTFSFSGGKWNGCPGRVYVFDQEFVQLNLHVADSVTIENKRSLVPIVLGEEGVELAVTINDLDQEQRDLDTVMKREGAIIQAKCPVVAQDKLSAFCSKTVPTDIAARVTVAGQVTKRAEQVTAVKMKVAPAAISLRDRNYFVGLLGRTIESISGDAVGVVEAHLQKHTLGSQGLKWLEFGTEHTEGKDCPYCDQSIDGNALVTTFRDYFSEAFSALIKEREEAAAAIHGLLSEKGLRATLDLHVSEYGFWSDVCTFPAAPKLSPAERDDVASGLALLESLLTAKGSSPLKPLDFGTDAAAIERAIGLVETYNAAVEACSPVIAAAQGNVQTLNVAEAQKTQQEWIALQEKLSEPVASAVLRFTEAEARKKAATTEKDAAQEALRFYSASTLAVRESEINALLTDFGANFQIVDAKASFIGREPNADWAISIGGHKVKAGEKSDQVPSFKTVLSAGDKTTLALAFFIAQVRADAGIASAVVVFDDPFSSQDLGRQFETTSQVRAIAQLACQTMVLSHDPRFLAMIEKDADTSIVRTYQLVCNDLGDGSVSSWLSAEELKALYVRQAETIREYASQGTLLKNVTVEMLAQMIRPFLEDYIRARHPGRFPDKTLLHPMIEEIQKAGAQDSLFSSAPDLLALNEYSRNYMHGGGTPPDPAALRAQCRKILRIVGTY